MDFSRCLSAVVAVGVVLSGCTTKQTQNSKEEPKSQDALKPISERPVAKKSTPKPKPYKAPIEPYALTPYTRSGYSKTFAKYGSRIAEVEAYRRKAAEAAARNPQCKKVTMAEISSYKGSINNMHFWVDCNDGMKRFTFTEGELDANVAAVTQSEKSFSKAQAGKLCEKLITRSVNYPSTLGVNNWDFGYKKFEPLGNVKVWMDFKAKNAFNLELKYTATCTFEPGNPNGEIVAKERTS
jgi:hypothetical protein